MLIAACWFVDNEVERLSALMQDLTSQDPHYRLKIVGHSLGAGTAAVLTFLIRTQLSHLFPPETVYCTGVATPACLSYELVLATSPYITTVVCEDDIVPRTSLKAVFELQQEVLTTDWKNDLPEGTMKKDFLKAMEATRQGAGCVASSVEESCQQAVSAMAELHAAHGGRARAQEHLQLQQARGA